MGGFALRSTKWTLELARKLIQADVRLNNAEVVKDDMAIIFAVNHFTRLETILLPYLLYKQFGTEVWSLAAAELFEGRIGKFLLSTGNVSTRDPDRDKVIIHSLLKGEHPWIIFPEGAMIKDKKVVDHRGDFSVYNRGTRRPPHTGAAVLALRAEFYRQKLGCFHENPKHDGDRDAVLERFNIESLEEVIAKRTVIVPVNVTYFPIRARENVFLRMARGVAKDLSPRAIEELSVEGTLIAKDTDIDVSFGDPIDVREYLFTRETAELLACGDHDMDALEADAGSLFNDSARTLMTRYMRDIYDLTTVNYDHIFGTILRHQRQRRFTERSYRNRIFLAAHQLAQSGKYEMHDLLENNYREIIYEDASPKFHDFMGVCLREGIVSVDGEHYVKNFGHRKSKTDFHVARKEALSTVIANEIEPLSDLAASIKHIAHMPREALSRRIREIFLEEDAAVFDADYKAFARPGDSKPMDVGRPFLLVPSRVKGGVVLVHGYMAAPLEIRALADYFYEHGFAVYGVRLKGHGTSPEDLARTNWTEWYESVNRGYAVIKSVTDYIVLGGFSTGGVLALLAAARKGKKVQAAFSICAPLQLRNYMARHASSVVRMNAVLSRLGRNPKEFVENDPENDHINYHRNPIVGVRELGEAMKAMESELPNVLVPTLVVQSHLDPVVDPVSGPTIFDKLGSTDKELTVFNRPNHGIINGDGSEEIFDRVLRFLHWARAKHRQPLPLEAAETAEAS